MKKLKVKSCEDCVLRFDSSFEPVSYCNGISSKKYPFGRPIEGIDWNVESFKPDWCPLESGDILVSLTKNEE